MSTKHFRVRATATDQSFPLTANIASAIDNPNTHSKISIIVKWMISDIIGNHFSGIFKRFVVYRGQNKEPGKQQENHEPQSTAKIFFSMDISKDLIREALSDQDYILELEMQSQRQQPLVDECNHQEIVTEDHNLQGKAFVII